MSILVLFVLFVLSSAILSHLYLVIFEISLPFSCTIFVLHARCWYWVYGSKVGWEPGLQARTRGEYLFSTSFPVQPVVNMAE